MTAAALDLCASGRHNDWTRHRQQRRYCAECRRELQRLKYQGLPGTVGGMWRYGLPVRIVDVMAAWLFDGCTWTVAELATQLETDARHVARALYRLRDRGYVARCGYTDAGAGVWRLTAEGEAL